MESSTSAVNWQPRNLAKEPGQLRRNALSHLARGADGIMFFQWRQSRAGAEKYHSGLVPHAGTDSKVWREVAALGAELTTLAPVKGTRVAARAALLWDYEAWWAVELDSHPSQDVRFLPAVRAWYESLWRQGITVDVVHPEGDLGPYDLLLAPSLYLLSDAGAKALQEHVRAGGSIVVQYFSGIVDENDHVRLGGYPGALRELLGVRVEEFFPLGAGGEVALSGGGRGTVWTELITPTGAEVVQTVVDGPLPGTPAVTRNAHGDGTAWYVATSLDPATLDAVLGQAAATAGVGPAADVPPGVEAVRRGDLLFVINHTGQAVAVQGTTVAAGDVAVLDVAG
jgi:beta-galactosidase